MDQHTASLSALCQALVAQDACATVVLDIDERVLACNAAAGTAFQLDADAMRGRALPEFFLSRRVPAIRRGIEAVRAQGGARSTDVEPPDGDMSIAPLRVDDRLVGFIVRRTVRGAADLLSAELDVTRATLEATRLELQTSLAEIATANDALRAKDEFLAMLAHELRTPLAPILSAVQILRKQVADNPMVHARVRSWSDRRSIKRACWTICSTSRASPAARSSSGASPSRCPRSRSSSMRTRRGSRRSSATS